MGSFIHSFVRIIHFKCSDFSPSLNEEPQWVQRAVGWKSHKTPGESAATHLLLTIKLINAKCSIVISRTDTQAAFDTLNDMRELLVGEVPAIGKHTVKC